MLRVAVPYGEISSAQLRVLAKIARDYDEPSPELLREAQEKQSALGEVPVRGGTPVASHLKFGYGRGTDDASAEIRYGRMTREEGIEMVRRYDHVRPRSLDTYLEFLQITEAEFEEEA